LPQARVFKIIRSDIGRAVALHEGVDETGTAIALSKMGDILIPSVTGYRPI
jgi:hypothetical protein